MAVYYYLPNKQALLDAIVEAVMGSIDLSVDEPAKPPEERILAAARAYRDVLLAHANALPILLAHGPVTPWRGRRDSISDFQTLYQMVRGQPSSAVAATGTTSMPAMRTLKTDDSRIIALRRAEKPTQLSWKTSRGNTAWIPSATRWRSFKAWKKSCVSSVSRLRTSVGS